MYNRKVIRGATGLVVGLALALSGLGCKGDKEERLTVPSTLAVGAYGGMAFGDACTLSDYVCWTETVESVDDITVDPPASSRSFRRAPWILSC
jgi:hypothetical protein